MPALRGGLTSFFFQYFLQGGLFFAVPLFLSIALGLSVTVKVAIWLPCEALLKAESKQRFDRFKSLEGQALDRAIDPLVGQR